MRVTKVRRHSLLAKHVGAQPADPFKPSKRSCASFHIRLSPRPPHTRLLGHPRTYLSTQYYMLTRYSEGVAAALRATTTRTLALGLFVVIRLLSSATDPSLIASTASDIFPSIQHLSSRDVPSDLLTI